jgi:hypothetical protein
MNIFEFIDKHPVLTVILAIIIFGSFAEAFKRN